MRILKKSLCCILCVTMLAVPFCGCEEEKKETILLETVKRIRTLDPQLAENALEKQITANIFSGLFSLDSDGNAQKALASDYTVSPDGKTYTITLKDSVWQDGRPVTASDFEYALKRATDPQLNAPDAYLLKNIKNAKSILSGKKPTSALGVVAKDSKTLQIILNTPDADFTKILATSVCMPCNPEFLESTKGYYGLKEDCVAYNGKFALDTWNEDYAKLTVNEQYTAPQKATYKSVYIYFNDEEELAENIAKAETDFTFLDYDFCRTLQKDNENLSIATVNNTVYSLIANRDALIGNEKILNALMSTADFEVTDANFTALGIKKSATVLPENINSSAKAFEDDSAKYKNDAENLFFEGCNEIETDTNFPTVTITYISSDFTEEIAKQIASNWQQKFGITVNITAVDGQNTLENTVKSGNYDFAIVPTTANTALGATYFEQFLTSDIYKNLEIDDNALTKTIKAIRSAKTAEDNAKACDDGAKYVIASPYLKPLFQTADIYYYGENFPQRINPFDYTISF